MKYKKIDLHQRKQLMRFIQKNMYDTLLMEIDIDGTKEALAPETENLQNALENH